MQFLYKNRIVSGLLLMGLLVFASSCLKKLEEVDQLNDNIFDREYEGKQWFVLESAEQVTNDLGQIRTRVLVLIPDEFVPDLEPSVIRVVVNANSYDDYVLGIPKDPLLGYAQTIDLPYEGAAEDYCLNIAIYDAENEDAFNAFDDCITITE